MDMENNQQQQKKNDPFPCDLVEEILLRLPVKSIVQFRSLSKQIQSRTSDPNFTKSNFDLCSSPPTIALLSIADHSVSAYSVDSGWVNLNKPIHHLKVRPSYLANNVASIIGSCRGFILLMLDEPNFLLWNPLTDAIKTMSYSPAPPSTRYLWHRDFCFGFGYDESIDDYLAVVVRKRSDADNFNVNQTNWTCFSVRNNSWRDIETKSDSDLSLESKFGVFCNGAIHWFGIKKHRLFQIPVIVALDLKEMRLSEIQIPIARKVDRALKVFEGCIALCLWHRESNKISIWEMKEYIKVCPNWTKRYVTIAFDDVSLYDPLYFNDSDELVAIKNGKQLVKFDEEGRLVIEHEASDDDPKREIIMFPLSLLSLPGHSNNTSNQEIRLDYRSSVARNVLFLIFVQSILQSLI